MYINVCIYIDIDVYTIWMYYTFNYLIDQRYTVTLVIDVQIIIPQMYIVDHGPNLSINSSFQRDAESPISAHTSDVNMSQDYDNNLNIQAEEKNRKLKPSMLTLDSTIRYGKHGSSQLTSPKITVSIQNIWLRKIPCIYQSYRLEFFVGILLSCAAEWQDQNRQHDGNLDSRPANGCQCEVR